MIITRDQIVNELKQWPFEVENFSPVAIDSEYFCPSLSWLQNEFGPWCLNHPLKYKKGKRDCDNIAQRTLTDAQEAWNENTEDEGAESECAVFLCDIKIVPTSVYFSTEMEFDFNGHETILVRCNNNEYYIFERSQGKAISLRDLVSNFIIDRIIAVRV